MFQFIEPDEQHLYRSRIFTFLEAIASYQKLYEIFENWEDGSFLLAQEATGNGNSPYCNNQTKGLVTQTVKGGALLLKQPMDLLHPRIQAHLVSLHPQMKEVWTGLISLQVHEDITGRDFEKVCRLFYSSLLADLIAFGMREGCPFLCTSMAPDEHRMIEKEEVWPYITQVKPETSKDELFHGVLTLTGVSQNVGRSKWIAKYLSEKTFH
jgi:hypothetical protein